LPPVSELDVEELHASLKSVRQTLNLALVGLIVVFASVNIVLLQQVAILRSQAVEMNLNSRRMISFLENHRTNGAPRFVAFIKEARRLAARDPRFAQVLAQFPRFELPGPPTNAPAAETRPLKLHPGTPR
jgi:hypothetical protein